MLDHLLSWSEHGHDRLLWVGGSSGNQDSWVTEMSTDLVQALQPRSITSLFIFCDAPDGGRPTPLTLVRRLLIQLLELRPQLAYRHPELCNTWRFQKGLVTFGQVWRVFEQLAAKVSGLFIVVDRVEECEADEQADLVHDLLPALIDLADQYTDISVIVTSICDPPEEVDELPLYSAYIDTSIVGKRISGHRIGVR